MSEVRYVIVTAAYNEEAHIEKTLDSVVGQSQTPVSWIIVSDGSTDRTDEIIREYCAKHDFIHFVRLEKDSSNHCFGAKVRALSAGLEALNGAPFDYIGILDADVSFSSEYFDELGRRFDSDETLGVGGGTIVQWIDGNVERRVKSLDSVAGAVQFFRRSCFEATGGFPSLEHGGEDAAIEITARMHGWRVQTFPDLEVVHYGYVGRAAGGRLRARFKWGQMNFLLGYHPMFEFVRCIYRVIEKPYIVGSIGEFLGFVSARIRYGTPRVAAEVVRYLRREQMQKLFGGRDRA